MPEDVVLVMPEPEQGTAPQIRSRWRRWLRPSAFLLALLLFPLPWLEVQCNTTAAKSAKAAGGGPIAAPLSAGEDIQEWLLDHLGLPSSRWEAFFTQSGIEAALGSYSIRDPGTTRNHDADDKRLRANLHASFVIALLPIILLLGLLSGLGWWRSVRRKRLMTASAVTAFALLMIQIISGFPLQQAVLTIEREDAVRNRELPSRITVASPGPGMRFHYTCWFGLVLCSMAGVIVAEGVDAFTALRRRRMHTPAARNAGDYVIPG